MIPTLTWMCQRAPSISSLLYIFCSALQHRGEPSHEGEAPGTKTAVLTALALAHVVFPTDFRFEQVRDASRRLTLPRKMHPRPIEPILDYMFGWALIIINQIHTKHANKVYIIFEILK